MTPDGDKKELFKTWVDAFDLRNYPVARPPWDPPLYAQETITERIEPYATQYDELARELPDDCYECGLPDPEFYAPTPRLKKLWRQTDTLRAKGFRQIPNPDYDPIRAEAWRKNWRAPFNQTKITVGQSYYTPPDAE